MNKETKISKFDKKVILYVIMIVTSVLLVVNFFFPFAVANENEKEDLLKNPKTMYAEEIGMTNQDAVNISLYEYFNIYTYGLDVMQNNQEVIITCLVIMGAIGVLSILTLLFSIIKKPICTIIFSVLTMLIAMLTKWDFADRRVIENSSYDVGISYNLYYVLVVVIIISK